MHWYANPTSSLAQSIHSCAYCCPYPTPSLLSPAPVLDVPALVGTPVASVAQGKLRPSCLCTWPLRGHKALDGVLVPVRARGMCVPPTHPLDKIGLLIWSCLYIKYELCTKVHILFNIISYKRQNRMHQHCVQKIHFFCCCNKSRARGIVDIWLQMCFIYNRRIVFIMEWSSLLKKIISNVFSLRFFLKKKCAMQLINIIIGHLDLSCFCFCFPMIFASGFSVKECWYDVKGANQKFMVP